MSKSIDVDNSVPPEESDRDIVKMLIKMQRQLVFLEKKIDSLMHQMQGGQYRGNSSMEKPFARKPYAKPLTASGRSLRRGNEKRKGKSEEKVPDQVFYSRFIKTGSHPGSGSRKKPFHHKKRKP